MIEDYLYLGIKKIELPSGKAIYSMDYEAYKRYRALADKKQKKIKGQIINI